MKKVKNYYDEFSSYYDENRSNRYFTLINSLEKEYLDSFIENKKVLEVGCGTGIILKEVAGKCCAFGIDLSKDMLVKAKEKNLKVSQATALSLPFKDETFDVTYSFKVLPHIKEVQTAVNEMKRVTKKGGLLVLEFYNPTSIKNLVNYFKRGEVFTRYDSFQEIKAITGNIKEFRGIRIITLSAFLIDLPVIGKIISTLERRLSNTFLNTLGGYFIVVVENQAK
ncbi:MAG: methyltransferase domain-containing protein [Candidatus Altiarchaeales archaeon]|nr:methyltransferase domain-containing protein [Candidatus Altiarchaeales archaeon]